MSHVDGVKLRGPDAIIRIAAARRWRRAGCLAAASELRACASSTVGPGPASRTEMTTILAGGDRHRRSPGMSQMRHTPFGRCAPRNRSGFYVANATCAAALEPPRLRSPILVSRLTVSRLTVSRLTFRASRFAPHRFAPHRSTSPEWGRPGFVWGGAAQRGGRDEAYPRKIKVREMESGGRRRRAGCGTARRSRARSQRRTRLRR